MEMFRAAMDSDLNTPAALAAVFDCMAWSRRSVISGDERTSLLNFCDVLRSTFGCFDAVEESIPTAVAKLCDARAAARVRKDFAESDRLRREMESIGYEVRDTQKGPVVRRK